LDLDDSIEHARQKHDDEMWSAHRDANLHEAVAVEANLRTDVDLVYNSAKVEWRPEDFGYVNTPLEELKALDAETQEDLSSRAFLAIAENELKFFGTRNADMEQLMEILVSFSEDPDLVREIVSYLRYPPHMVAVATVKVSRAGVKGKRP